MSEAMPAAATSGATLARNRQLANGVLALMGLVYLLTHAVSDPSVLVMLIRAMAEAGMIGGLADWFAVTALFRHPLGLPIPHTALLPRNQPRAARNVGVFFERHFLSERQVEERILAVEPSAHLAGWLGRRENAVGLARQIADAGSVLPGFQLSRRILARARGWVRRQVLNFGSDDIIARVIAPLLKSGFRSRFVEDAIKMVQQAVAQNREAAAEIAQENSRWWIATAIDRRVANLVVNALVEVLDELRKEGPLRDRLENGFEAMIDRMESEGVLARGVSEARRKLVRLGVFDELSARALAALSDQIALQIETNPETIAGPLADLIQEVAARLSADPTLCKAADARLASLAGRIIGEARQQIGGHVTDVIAGWEPAELNARFEEEIGPDLQFIRINGAILGAVIGGALFAVNLVLR